MKSEQQFLHEISGPLSVAFGYASMILEDTAGGTLPGDVREKLEAIQISLEKLSESVRLRRQQLVDAGDGSMG